jgi:hypothetical protein
LTADGWVGPSSRPGLAFRGFQLERGVFARFRETFPGEAWPGSLQRRAEFEDANPHHIQWNVQPVVRTVLTPSARNEHS